MSDSVGERLRRNTRSGMITWFWGQVLMVLRMMVYFNYLDLEGYGLWLLAFDIMSYFVFYNFGINTAFIKYTAEYHAREEHSELSHLLSTGLAFALFMGGSIVLFLMFFTDAAVGFFDFEAKNIADAEFVVRGVGVVTAFSIGFGVYSAVLTGIQRLDLLNICRAIFLTFEVAAGFVCLRMGLGVRALVFVYGASVVGGTIVTAYIARRHVPQLRLNPLLARARCLPALFSLGVKMQLLGAIAMIATTVDSIVFAKYEGLAFVGVYGIARRVASRSQGAALQSFGALAPASADLFARGDRARISEVYGTALRICGLGSAYMFGFIAINSDYTMLLFEGDKYEPLSAWALSFLCIAMGIHTLSGPGSSMLRGAGYVWREMLYQAVTLVLFLLFFAAARYHGVHETLVVLSYPVALSIASLLFILMVNRFFGVATGTPFVRLSLLILLAPLAAYAVRLLWLLLPFESFGSRWWALVVIMAMGIPYTVLFALAAWYVPGLTRSDKEQVVKFIPGARRLVAWLP